MAKKLTACFFAFRFPPDMTAAFNGDEQFVPLRYDTAWQAVRDVAAAVGALQVWSPPPLSFRTTK